MNEIDTPINPNEWTTKELVKHLYRELKEIKENQSIVNETLALLKKDLEERKFMQEEAEKKRKNSIALVALISSIGASILTALAQTFSK